MSRDQEQKKMFCFFFYQHCRQGCDFPAMFFLLLALVRDGFHLRLTHESGGRRQRGALRGSRQIPVRFPPQCQQLFWKLAGVQRQQRSGYHNSLPLALRHPFTPQTPPAEISRKRLFIEEHCATSADWDRNLTWTVGSSV